VIYDSVEATVGGVTFFGTQTEIFNFFSRSLKRWAESALTENVGKLKLKNSVQQDIKNKCGNSCEEPIH